MPTTLLTNQYHREIYVSDEKNSIFLQDLQKFGVLHKSLKTLPKRFSLKGRTGITLFSEHPVIIVRILPAYMMYPVLVHELFHCVVEILRDAGFGPLNDHTEEGYAYLMEHLVAQCSELF